MTDTEKLNSFAHEVYSMIKLQADYFKTAKLGRQDKAAPDEVKKALNKSIAQESRVKKLIVKIFQSQNQIPGL